MSAKQRTKPTAQPWRNRIVGHGEESPDRLLENPANWRVHPQHQQDALAGVLSEVGWVQDVIVNRGTGHLIDGHLRVALARSRKEPTVPVLYVDLTEEEEALVLATLDPISAMATADKERLDALLRHVQTGDAAVQQMLADLASESGLYADDADADETDARNALAEVADELAGAMTLKADMAFPSKLPFGIPELRHDRLLDIPDDLELWPGDDLRATVRGSSFLLIYSCSCRTLDFTRAILAFYTDDIRFESLWNYPDKMASRIINAGLLGCVAPNFSLWPDQAQAVHIWQVYRSRWCARYFQEAGIPVIPDVNWADADDYDFSMAGIPVGAPCLSVQVQTFRSDRPDEVARVRAGLLEVTRRLQPQKLLVYASKAGRQLVQEVLPDYPKVILPTLMDCRRDKLNRRKLDEQAL